MRAFLALCCCAALTVQAETFSAKVIVVLDGDTIMVLQDCERQGAQAAVEQRRSSCKRKLKVRLSNIDAPEKAQAFGKQSRDSLQEMLGKKEVLVDSRAVDQYGRIVGLISVDGLNINQEQVRRGMAWAAPGWYGKRRKQNTQVTGDVAASSHASTSKTYIALQNEAQQAHRGLWKQPDPMPPWQWRKLHPTDKPAAHGIHR